MSRLNILQVWVVFVKLQAYPHVHGDGRGHSKERDVSPLKDFLAATVFPMHNLEPKSFALFIIYISCKLDPFPCLVAAMVTLESLRVTMQRCDDRGPKISRDSKNVIFRFECILHFCIFADSLEGHVSVQSKKDTELSYRA